MSQLRKSSLIVALIGLLLTPPASATACGDKLLLLGRAVRLQAYKTQRPSAIALITLSDEKAHQRIVRDLQSIGHRVSVIRGASFSDLSQERGFDLVVLVPSSGGRIRATDPPVTIGTPASAAHGGIIPGRVLPAKAKSTDVVLAVEEVLRARAPGRQ